MNTYIIAGLILAIINTICIMMVEEFSSIDNITEFLAVILWTCAVVVAWPIWMMRVIHETIKIVKETGL